MNFSIQETLENERVKLVPLVTTDFDGLYQVASDSKIWEQHPNKDRWKKEVFQQYFEGAIKSEGAFKIIDKATGEIAGSTRFYDYNEADSSILIGYTFYATRYWGSGLNPAVKQLMMDYIFQYVNKVVFHIGATNLRSQIAITRLGAEKTGEENVAYYGEPSKLNFVYAIRKDQRKVPAAGLAHQKKSGR
jgi:RimJ/RimL family protein N-acetyltransferase